jgi:hypothetical protein
MAAVAIAWLIALIPSLSTLALWQVLGGHLFAPETINLLGGHLLYGLLVGAIALFSAPRRSAGDREVSGAAGDHGASRTRRSPLRRSASQRARQARAGRAAREHSTRKRRANPRRKLDRGSVRRDRILLRRPVRQEPVDQPPRSPADPLGAGGMADSDANRRRGIPRLSARRRSASDAAMVLRRAPALDLIGVVVDVPAATYPSVPHARWRFIMKTSTCTIATAIVGFGLAALLLRADLSNYCFRHCSRE